MSLTIICNENRRLQTTDLCCSAWRGSGGGSTSSSYLLYHDAVDAHVLVTPGEVKYVHPAESEAQHQKADVQVPSGYIQPSEDQVEEALHKTVNKSCSESAKE